MPEFDSTVEYRAIPGFPGYRVGSDGTIWGCRRRGSFRLRVFNEDWHQMKLTPGRKGHLRVLLYVGIRGKQYSRSVHRLVLEAFVGPCPPGMMCRHFPDQSPSNNRLENLRWGSNSENQLDRVENGTSWRGERHPQSKMTADQVRAIRAGKAAGRSYLELAKEYGVCRWHISAICRRKVWAHLD